MKNSAFSFVEVIVTVAVAASLIGGILFFTTGVSLTTTKTAAYYQALQIAMETLDWVQSISADLVDDKLCAVLSGSLVDLGTLKSGSIPVSSIIGSSDKELHYPDSYAKRFFHRKLEVQRLKGSRGRFLVKVTVTISWNEGKQAEKVVSSFSEKRMRELSLVTVLFDETEYY
ncbi:MAG: hypothetical protein CVV41_02970 [Candidatus Riflebacteria bacterium HGW-Riflebacteria-1]|jgi:hypothetical protein|nr:MAG: hypothetical protein CVV41_02970 [Candidatus Riflebacteria bacterium HGW-Riflebacteria-1]